MNTKKKKKDLTSSIENDIKRSDKLAFRAQVEKGLSVHHISNSLKKLVKQEREELNVLNKEEILKEKCHAWATF